MDPSLTAAAWFTVSRVVITHDGPKNYVFLSLCLHTIFGSDDYDYYAPAS